MNRVLVGTMLEVAGGRRREESFAALLRAGRAPRRANRPAHGLYLESVAYCHGETATATTPTSCSRSASRLLVPGRRAGADPSGSASGTSRLRCSTTGLPAREAQAGPLLTPGTRWTTPPPGSRPGRTSSRPPRRLLRSCSTSRATTLRDQEGHAAVGRAVSLEGRAPRALLPRPRRARVRHLERGQPRQPADLSQPDARRRSSSARCTAWSRGAARRARWSRSTCSTRPASSATCAAGIARCRRPSAAGPRRGHPQLRRRQPRAHDVHPRASSARRTATTVDELLVHRDRGDRELRSQLPVQHVARRVGSRTCSSSRARYRTSGVERAYVYNWTGAGCARASTRG